MPRTHAEMVTLILTRLMDAGIDPGGTANQVFATAEVDAYIKSGLAELSGYKPYQVKNTSLLTTVNSRDITLTSEVKHNLFWIDYIEYKVAQDPPAYRNWKQYGDIVTLKIDCAPTAAESVYLYLSKKHRLQKEVGTVDLAAAVKTTAAAGVSSIILKSLGTGTINEDTQLTIAGDATVYHVTGTATIATNEATVSITPVLAAQAAADAVVTLALSTSTLDITLEDLLADLAAAHLAIDKARGFIGGVTVAGNSAQEFIGWGNNKLALTLQDLRGMGKGKTGYLYPTD